MSKKFERFKIRYLVEKDDGSEGVFVPKPGSVMLYEDNLILGFYAGAMHVLNPEMVDADEEVLRDELQIRYDNNERGKMLVNQYDYDDPGILDNISVFSEPSKPKF